jgi:hypothetical protein
LGSAFRPAVGYYDKVEHDRHCRDSGSHDSLQYCPPQIHWSLVGDTQGHKSNKTLSSVELIGRERVAAAAAQVRSGDEKVR